QLAGAAAEVPALATRAAGWLPNEYGGKQAVEATKALEGVGGKEGHVVGEFAAPFLFPWGRAAEGIGEGAGALGRAVGLTGKAAETAEAAAPAAEVVAKDVPLLKRMGSGALSAAPGGALWGGTQFGGTEEDYGRRLTEKGVGAAGGALGGASLGAAGAFGSKAMEKMAAISAEGGDKAAKELTGKVAATVEGGLKAKETEAREAEAWKTHLEGLTEQQQRDVNMIADLRQMREDRRATFGGNAPKDFNARRQMVEETQKLREDAKRAGLSAEETNARVMDETERVALAEAAAFGLEADLRARPQATPQEVGGKLQQAASNIYEHGVAARKKAAGIEQVLAKADKPVDAAGVVNYVDKVVEDIPSTHPARAVLERVKRDAMGAKEESAEQTPEILPGETPSQASARRAKSQEASEAAKDEPGTMSLRKLEALRSTIRSALQTKTMKLD